MRLLFALNLILITSVGFAFTMPKAGEKTKDIGQYASMHSEFPKKGFERFNCSTCSALKDSVFVTPISTCGTGACDYMLFKNNHTEATYVTTVSLKPGAFEFLKTSHNGLPDIKVYRHMSGDDGTIGNMEFDGTAYKVVGKEKKIASADLQKEMKSESVVVETFK